MAGTSATSSCGRSPSAIWAPGLCPPQPGALDLDLGPADAELVVVGVVVTDAGRRIQAVLGFPDRAPG
jgi:hypothetical protein